MLNLRLGFLGAGQMSTALARGWIRAGLLQPSAALASDVVPEARERFTAATGITTTASNRAVAAECDLLVLAVKPQTLPSVLEELQGQILPRHLMLSIVAGARLEQLQAASGEEARVVRVMPNTPALLGCGAAGLAGGPRATPEDLATALTLFNAVGLAFALPESLLDAVTGLSGSGPAFVYVMIEALADGGVRMGLPREAALKLAAQTVLGAARMVLETGLHPAALKDAVASPAGTTIAGLHALERAGVRAGLMDAVEAAAQRAQELGQPPLSAASMSEACRG